MAGILLDARKIKAYEDLKYLGKYTGKDDKYISDLWKAMLLNNDLYEEFIYYIDNQTLKDKIKCHGYALTDLYVWLLDRYNLMQDLGKHGSSCVKESIVLDTFKSMTELIANPDSFILKMNSTNGYDKM